MSSDHEQIHILAHRHRPQRRMIEADIEDSLLLFRPKALSEAAVGSLETMSGGGDPIDLDLLEVYSISGMHNKCLI